MDNTDKVIECLNQAWESDPMAVRALLINLVPCNQALADHPLILAQKFDEGFAVGFIGLLNGLMGSMGFEYVATKWTTEPREDGSHEFLGFCRYNKPK